ncbi:MAG: hypothetical protein UY48_C0022G0003 [Candidatus Gottesmanbacteria bacterium GW2011_GWB1_49_7]|uniref:Phage head-tail adaptor n=1 Tax=Candidatus Gottesmanbacteria bacterium GW2011_GWB1_49_7 TaxID=1618448 RepID=A0A0G1VY54_9BACT|nr:MAG: hypothetical protein UY48_C0022G0003 [Candidatus Gottesmanbacteria bacterium GW2011_GWB1_49_7]
MSSILTAAEIASMRASLQDIAMPDLCNILNVTLTSDGQGGMTQTWGTANTDIPCRLDAVQMRGREQVAGAAIQAFHGYALHVPYNITITSANRVEHGGYTYEVKSVDFGKSWQLDKICEVERI